ncbi:DUF3467 domain-containing protein [Rhizobium leguminosarum]|uniref:DUF3467 domain-containing protein n=1 Tax=Rhizobium leguminosarum TaxID=384 RepID=UPI00293DEC9D|nr:DUF3467 domain-containing protein [Rhizobium leguminosarum]MDV4164406.1 DUF3467 domain-containing protein [Rhizobium leguminosarum]MDV4174692.1 DUF3467 domain-containing protein [Rhizobium leguminosarum]
MNRLAKNPAPLSNEAADVEMGKVTVAADSGNAAHAQSQTKSGETPPPVRLNTANLKSTYCNVCNATSTREEVVLNFGTNHNWDRPQRDLEIELHHRIVLSPFAAKRLRDLMTKLIDEHERRYGELH